MALSTLETLRLTVAALRQRTGESQAQLAAGIGLTQDKVSRRQAGAQPWGLDEVDALARHWGLAPLDLLAGPTRAAESMTWPPGTAAPRQPVPDTFAAAPATPATAPAAPGPDPGRRPAPRRRSGPYTPVTPVPESWVRPGERDDAPADTAAEQPAAAAAAAAVQAVDYDRGPDGEPAEHPAAPCEQCGRPVRHRVAGRPLHLGGWCAPATVDVSGAGPVQAGPAAAVAALVQDAAPAPDPTPADQAPDPTPTPAPAAPAPASAAAPGRAARPASAPSAAASRSEYAGTGRDLGYYLDMITSAVEQALEEHDGDTEAATTALEKRAIPNGMALFDATRVGGNYEHTVYPDRLEFLSKKTRSGADDVWEGRHKWENTPLMESVRRGDPAEVAVDVLDTNAAYCSALKTHLPIGALVHQPDGGFDPKRSGIYLLPKRPTWEHPDLPDPIGNRHETGPVLLDGATVRLLIRCHKLGLADAPHITEAWTSGSSEGLLEKFRRVLTQARENAIADGDQITEKYVKAMYAKFASTIGESTFNRDIRRPDWMHIIRSQAFANLWYKAHRAHKAGIVIVRLRGTDELHVTGETDWRSVFTEGRLTTQMKLKDQYTLPLTRKRSA
ncbi:helix-turn-helix transcriptional regulator [Kitasatospora sp. NPDC002965]|uniref:helix-turn-helix domain-containing protein n=1 Tax=Kitasatospora sp. NPDC002965 TaxID=3154775 RepID=UPI0033AAC508